MTQSHIALRHRIEKNLSKMSGDTHKRLRDAPLAFLEDIGGPDLAQAAKAAPRPMLRLVIKRLEGAFVRGHIGIADVLGALAPMTTQASKLPEEGPCAIEARTFNELQNMTTNAGFELSRCERESEGETEGEEGGTSGGGSGDIGGSGVDIGQILGHDGGETSEEGPIALPEEPCQAERQEFEQLALDTYNAYAAWEACMARHTSD
ncbi:MAG: hypothetical protein ACRBCL_09515 [Maritimibacter sp.]